MSAETVSDQPSPSDDRLRSGRPQLRKQPVYCFSIVAAAEPGIMPRVLELFAKRNLVPLRLHSDRLGPSGTELAIDIQIGDLTPQLIDYIARCLRQIYGVETVLTSEKGFG